MKIVNWGLLFHIALMGTALADTLSSHSFTFRVRGEPQTLDWNKASTAVESALMLNLMEGLVTYDSPQGAKGEIAPALAEKWTLSRDRKTYTFKLRQGVKWSDGVTLRAQDFVYSWKRLLAPYTVASYSYLLNDVVGAADFREGKLRDFSKVGVKAINDSTLQVTLNKPVSHWIHIPTFWPTFPLREDIVEKYGDGWASPGRMVNLGPFSIVQFDHESKIVMRANPNYYGARGNIDEITALILGDDHTALQLYQAGKLDVLAEIATTDLKKIKNRKDLKTFPQLKTGYIGFVVTKYPASNLKLRRAIAMAIDKSKFDEILNGYQKPATSFVPPPLLGHSKDIGLPFYPKKAQFELRDSGLDTTVPLQIEYMHRDWDRAEAVVKFIQSELKKNLGIDVVLKPYENKSFQTLRELYSYPMFDYSWNADYPDPDNFLSLFLSTVVNDFTGWINKKYDQMLMAARESSNPSERRSLYTQMQKLLIEDEAVIVPLYYEPNLVLVQNRVKNFQFNVLNYLYLRHINVVPLTHD